MKDGQKRLRIVLLSDLEAQGGAAVAASRLAQGLCDTGHQVTRLVAVRDGAEHPWKTVVLSPTHPVRDQIVRRLIPGCWRGRRDRFTVHRLLERALRSLQPDVINLHNLHWASWRGWSPEMATVCATHAPTVWTLHDMWSFTGRCAYSESCRKFLQGCDASCPTPNEYPALPPGEIAGAWSDRRRLFTSGLRLTAVTPSRWLAVEAQHGFWAGHRVEVIPNGLRLDVYKPAERELARKALGIETAGPVLLMAGQTITDRRKGGELLVAALSSLNARPLTILTLGSGRLPVNFEGICHHSLGHIDHERTLALAYSAADLFVHPSLADNLPNVVAEAIACGTPVAGFPVGGMPEMVRAGHTGWLAREVSPAALAETLELALSELTRGVNLRAACRSVAEQEYGHERQVGRYVALFQSLCSPESGRPAGI